jgi:hypothetical protein
VASSGTLDHRVALQLERAVAPLYAAVLVVGVLFQVVALPFSSMRLSLVGLAIASVADIATSRQTHPLREKLAKLSMGPLNRVAVRAALFLGSAASVIEGGLQLVIAAYAVVVVGQLLATGVFRWRLE